MSNEKSIAFKEKVFARIQEGIIAQEFPPGCILNERKLAKELDVSRTPVREAIQMLEREGWVNVVPWRGAIVKAVTTNDIIETFHLRMAIEVLSIELTLNELGPAEIQVLEELWQEQLELAKKKDAVNFILKDQDFHLYLAGLTKNRRLYEVMSQLRDVHLRMGVEAIRQEARFDSTLEEHQSIIDALKEKNYFEARQAMLDHLSNTRHSLIRQIRKDEKKEVQNEG